MAVVWKKIAYSGDAPTAHNASHQDGGGDEISVTALSGLLADDQHVLDAEVRSAAVSDTAYAASWNGVTTIAPSKNAVYDKIEALGGGGNTIVWLAASVRVLSDLNRTSFLNWTDLDLTAQTSANAKFAILSLSVNIVSISSDAYIITEFRKNGDSPTYSQKFIFSGVLTGFDSERYHQFIMALDVGQVLEYKLAPQGTVQFDTQLFVLGYIE